MSAHTLAGAAISLALVPGLLLAQQPSTPKDTVPLTKLVQYSVPAIPALAFIGSTSEKITRPTAPKELVTAFSNSVDESGRVAQGLAVELSPRQLLWSHMDAEEYRTLKGFLVANTAFSLGSVKVAGDTSSTNVGFGARVTLFDRSDPMTVQAPVLAALNTCAPNSTRNFNAAQMAAFKKCFGAADSAFHADFRRQHWNDWALTVSLASGFQLANSELRKRNTMGYALDALAAAPLCFSDSEQSLCRSGQWLVRVGLEQRDSIVGVPKSSRRLLFGARGTIGSETSAFFAEVLHSSLQTGVTATQKKNRTDWSAGFEFRLAEKMWATAGFGSRYNDAVGKDKAVILAGLRVNLKENRTLDKLVPK